MPLNIMITPNVYAIPVNVVDISVTLKYKNQLYEVNRHINGGIHLKKSKSSL